MISTGDVAAFGQLIDVTVSGIGRITTIGDAILFRAGRDMLTMLIGIGSGRRTPITIVRRDLRAIVPIRRSRILFHSMTGLLIADLTGNSADPIVRRASVTSVLLAIAPMALRAGVRNLPLCPAHNRAAFRQRLPCLREMSERHRHNRHSNTVAVGKNGQLSDENAPRMPRPRR
jgi:hypothetical protein